MYRLIPNVFTAFFMMGAAPLLAQDGFDLDAALAGCPQCAEAVGEPVCVMIEEGIGTEVPNACYAECLGFPMVGPWFCAAGDGGGGTETGDGGGGTETGDGGGGTETGDGGGGTETGDGGGGTETGDGGGGTETGADSDEDGLTDEEEGNWGSDENNEDTDGDGLTDGEEVNLFGTSPVLTDTDGNGRSDAVDLALALMDQINLCPSDINRDGVVSVDDMLLFLSDFADTCTN